jgi:hypothetical protein
MSSSNMNVATQTRISVHHLRSIRNSYRRDAQSSGSSA